MPDRDSKSGALPGVDETLTKTIGFPAHLSGDPRRQAVPSIHGDVYQAWWSIDAWLRLADADEVIYLEGSEDFDIVKAEELNKLMFSGYHVYHDFPAEKFNIDHILIGSAGIFAVETKTRSKRESARGKSSVEITYDGKRLSFPDGYYDVNSLTQAKDQASWLARWLSSAVGEKVNVEPIVTIPGWFVKRISPEGMPVLNPKKGIESYITSMRKGILSDAMITRIVHQIDQRCRNIEPKDHLV